MGFLERIYEILATHEAKKDQLRNLILLLMIESNNFEDHTELTHKCLKECANELRSSEAHFSSVQESLSQSSKEMDLIRQSLEQRLTELEETEKEFYFIQEKGKEELRLKEETLKFICNEVEVKGEKLNEQEKLIKGLFEKFELERKEFEIFGNLVGERLEDIGLKENQMEKRANELDFKGQKLVQRDKEIESREKNLELLKKEIQLELRKCDSTRKPKKQKFDFSSALEGNSDALELSEESSAAPSNIAVHDEQINVADHQKETLSESVDWTTFWTFCPFCDVRFDYFKHELDKVLCCENCSKFFIASVSESDLGYVHSRGLESDTGAERNVDVGADTRVEVNVRNVNIVEARKGEFYMPGIDARQPDESGELKKKDSNGLESGPGRGTEGIADVFEDKRTHGNVENADIIDSGKGEFDLPGIEARQPGESGELRKGAG